MFVKLNGFVVDGFEGLAKFDGARQSFGLASGAPEFDDGASGDIESAIGLFADVLGLFEDFVEVFGNFCWSLGFDLADFAGRAVVAHDLFEIGDAQVRGFCGGVGLIWAGGVEREAEFSAHMDFGIGVACGLADRVILGGTNF